jgi:hypothetical protein
MPEDQKRIEIALLLALSGLPARDDASLDRLARGLEGTRAVVNIFASVNFADTLPAGRFRPPARR